MSQPAPRPPAPVDPIRQQLDELDALLQRMLSLPASPAEAEAAPAPEPPPAADALAPLPPPLPPPRTVPPPPPVFLAPSPASPPPWTDPIPPTTRAAEPPRPPVPPTPAAPPLSPAPAPLPLTLRPSPWLAPLLWLDRGFEAAVGPLGPLGRWLRKPGGRAVLGWAGVLCLAAALALVLLDWLGWTRLPGLLQ